MIVEIIRHGETELSAQGRYQGSTDAPLSERGRLKLRKSVRQPDLVYVTPLRRTAQTADILFPGVKQIPLSGLAEMDFGVFEGRLYRELSGCAEYQAWVDSMCETRCPGGESKAEFCQRVCAAFAALLDSAASEARAELIIVAHGGTQMAVMERYALPQKSYFDWRLPPGQGYRLDASGWRSSRRLSLLEITDYTKE